MVGSYEQPNVHAVHREWDRKFPVIVRAEGIYMWDSDGKRYIDGSGGSSVVTSIGHGVEEVSKAMYEQSKKFSFYPAHEFTNEQFLKLSDMVVGLAPGTMKDNSRVWLTCTGSDATDDSARLARQYWVEKGIPTKFQIITRWQAFHGSSIAASGFSGITSRRSIFQQMYVDSPHIPPAFCYRCSFEQSLPQCNLLCARYLETAIRQQGPENVAAFIAEPVVGAALGGYPAPDGYFKIIREICDKYDVLFIADEVMTGWGRTGKLWGVDHWDVTPDIIATAKGMTSGYTPLSAVIAKEEIWSVLEDANSAFNAGHTLNANAVSCAGAIEVINYLLKNNLVENARERGVQALKGLEGLKTKHPSIGNVHGLGLLFGFELVKDKTTKEPFDKSIKVSRMIEDECLARGLCAYPRTGTVDGTLGHMIQMAPPLVINADQMDELINIMDEAVTAVEKQIGVV